MVSYNFNTLDTNETNQDKIFQLQAGLSGVLANKEKEGKDKLHEALNRASLEKQWHTQPTSDAVLWEQTWYQDPFTGQVTEIQYNSATGEALHLDGTAFTPELDYLSDEPDPNKQVA